MAAGPLNFMKFKQNLTEVDVFAGDGSQRDMYVASVGKAASFVQESVCGKD